MSDDDKVDQLIAEGWIMYDEIVAKWADLMQQQEHLSLAETLEMVQQMDDYDDLPSQRLKTEVIGNIIYPSVFKLTK